MTPPNPQNRRRHERFFLLGLAKLACNGREVPVQVINRSKGGVYVLSALPLPLQTEVELTVALPGSNVPAHLGCRVMRVERFGEVYPHQSGLRMSLAKADGRSRDRWLEFTQELSRGILYGQPSLVQEESEAGRTSRRPELLLDAWFEAGQERLVGKVTNVGGHGASLLLPGLIREGTKGVVGIRLPDVREPARFPAEIAWSRPSSEQRVGLGLEIVSFREGRALWESHVQDDIITLF